MLKLFKKLAQNYYESLNYLKENLSLKFLRRTILFALLLSFLVLILFVALGINLFIFLPWLAITIILVACFGIPWFYFLIFGGLARGYNEEFHLKYKNALYFMIAISVGLLLALIFLTILVWVVL
ncbi:MAG: hypothetical protein LBV55_00500 [Acholeplasmatales bacterium]|jgi:hypothetical protein|nr:hypothetical protein [Acholeplasmatales bacterium]